MTDLQHLQKVLLGIIKDIDEICADNDIIYYLTAGSALGAVRHKGFIPWDDDFDIAMDAKNYIKFLHVAREKLDHTKYFIQEGYKDWPMPFSKIRLLGTLYRESDIDDLPKEYSGIFIDVFPLENAPNNKFARLWQFFCGKILLSYCLRLRGYKSASLSKQIMMFISHFLDIRRIRKFFQKQVEKYRDIETEYVGSFSGNLKYGNHLFKKSDWGIPLRVLFEDTLLPIPSGYDSILRNHYGDYMTLPPENQRIGPHLTGLEFGKY